MFFRFDLAFSLFDLILIEVGVLILDFLNNLQNRVEPIIKQNLLHNVGNAHVGEYLILTLASAFNAIVDILNDLKLDQMFALIVPFYVLVQHLMLLNFIR